MIVVSEFYGRGYIEGAKKPFRIYSANFAVIFCACGIKSTNPDLRNNINKPILVSETYFNVTLQSNTRVNGEGQMTRTTHELAPPSPNYNAPQRDYIVSRQI
ncbi:hypothetical protein TNCV_351891 [Trichonephila clavipes]|nr:hypothetical protein TNCV_351891 [Trichonephila clavipes]